MKSQTLLYACTVFSLTAFSITGFAQAKGTDYVPCQEMPNLMLNYTADYRAVNRFYSPASTNARGFGGAGDAGTGSPEKRERLATLYRDYLKKLETLSFKNLPQECKVDYILFKRDLVEKLRLSAVEEKTYAVTKGWFPFADQVYSLEKMRRRGGQPSAEKVAREWATIADQVKTLSAKLKEEKNLDPEVLYQGSELAANVKASLASINEFTAVMTLCSPGGCQPPTKCWTKH